MTSPPRKLWLDWQRGLAVLFMVEVHVLDAWLAPGAGDGFLFHALRILGGLAAPGFLFMAGLSQGLADAALARKGLAPAARRAHALRRGVWLLGVSYGLRVALFLLGGFRQADGLREILKVDVLDVIGVGLLLGAVLAVGRSRAWAIGLSAAAAAAIVLATPLVADVLRHYDAAPGGGAPPLRAPNVLVDVLYAYLYGRPPRSIFFLFNWVAFLLAGAALAPLAAGPRRPLAWLLLGAALFGLGAAADRLPDVYAYQSFWRTSPAWFAMRLGLCVGIAGALQLLPDLLERPLAWLTLLGRQSLVGYIASVQLTYGALASPLAKRLSLHATLAAIAAMTGVTWAISFAWERLQASRKARAAGSRAAPA
jgi:Heparan-alpha-glucosaminide N-acetyltransferase, catalytic